MEKHKKVLPLVAKLVGGAAFMALFIFNIMVYVHKDGKTNGLSLSSIKAFADDSAEESSIDWLWQKVMTETKCQYKKQSRTQVCGYTNGVWGCHYVTTETTYTGRMSRCDDGDRLCLSGCEGS